MFNLQLANIRKAAGYTQENLANALGTSRRIVGAWERGECEFPFDEAFKVCAILGCTFEQLAGEDPFVPRVESRVEQMYSKLDDQSKAVIDDQLEFQAIKTKNRQKNAE